MKTALAYFLSVVVGIVFGIVANHGFLRGSWFNLIIWAVVGILIGIFILDKKYVTRVGILYGIFLTISFMISGFQGSADKLVGFSILTCVLAIIGALCGWLTVYIGYWIKGKF